MQPDKKPLSSENKDISIGGDVSGIVIVGDNNVVNKQTIIQKFFNIFKSDSETLEHRNRRILLGHVENAWIKGVLDASLHGAALLDLGIKQDPEAVTKYPWAIQKESTKETLPAGTFMLDIFDSIGMGRSLLILGAPGSGKTTMLLELARGLIARAREDVTQPIPMVFNLSSWTESKTLVDWLAQELNNLYSVPRKTAPDWVKGDKLLLLLDGLDEVRQESRAKCVEAINAFRKEYGLTSLAVCSRSQDYAAIKAKLSFEGAIEVQPLTQEQITKFFNRFGDEMAGIKQALEKDSALREMAETPLFLSIMIMAYRDKQVDEIPVFADMNMQRKYLFDHYIERMIDRYQRPSHKLELKPNKTAPFKKQDVLYWLSWLAWKMSELNQTSYLLENMQPVWLDNRKQLHEYRIILSLTFGLIGGSFIGLIGWLIFGSIFGSIFGLINGLMIGLFYGLMIGLFEGKIGELIHEKIGGGDKVSTIDSLSLNWNNIKVRDGLIFVLIIGLSAGLISGLIGGLNVGLTLGLTFALMAGLPNWLSVEQADRTTYPGQRIVLTAKNFIFVFLLVWLLVGLTGGLMVGLFFGLDIGLTNYGGFDLIKHYFLRLILARNNLLPWRLVPFLDHCVDLIFLRRVGGGYIFVHRLLMEHFAEMYVETTK